MSKAAALAEGPAVQNVLVVGGGIGGLSAAIALCRRGVRTTVVERDGHSDGANIGFKYRALYTLEDLGILDQIMEQGLSREVGGETRFEAYYKANGEPVPMGAPPQPGDDFPFPVTHVHLLRPILSEIMRNAAREQGAELVIGHTYRSVEAHASEVVVELTSGDRHAYDLVVGADGIHSGLRERFFPEVAPPAYLGKMTCRVMFDNAPTHWHEGTHIALDGINRILTHLYPDGRFHLAVGKFMERRYVDEDEARAIIREGLEPYRGTAKMFDEMYEQITDQLDVVVTPLEWIYVPPPWHRGRIVLVGDALHGTAPTIGSGGQMALEDSVVLAQELAKVADVREALAAYAKRREGRAKFVAEISASLVRFDRERRPNEEETSIRRDAMQQLVAPY